MSDENRDWPEDNRSIREGAGSPEKDFAEPVYKTDDFEFNIDLTTDTGVKTPMTATITFPEGQGLWALRAMGQFEFPENEMLMSLINRQDASTIEAAFKAGYQHED